MEGVRITSEREHLLIYVWAMTIVVVISVIFYTAGVLKSSSSIGTACQAKIGYTCSSPVLSTSGNLTVTLTLEVGPPIYNVGLACVSTPHQAMLPNPESATVYIANNGSATSIPANSPAAGFVLMFEGRSIRISGLKCFGTNTKPLAYLEQGSALTEYMWINYTSSPGAPSDTNRMYTSSLAIITANVM